MKTANNKTVFAVWHSAGKGKSDTLRQFAVLVQKEYPKHKIIDQDPNPITPNQDFRLVIEINGQTIGIESQGDPGTGLQKRLLQLVNQWRCDVILCTCRTKGETVHAVEHLASQGFRIIWTSTYQVRDTSRETEANQLKARHMLDFLREFKVLKP